MKMLVISTFENSLFIEMAISSLEQKGIPKENIFAAPLDKPKEQRQLFDTIHRADGVSLFDVGAILGTCFMLLGAIYGFVLNWGPIIWGIIGALSGLIIGILIKIWIVKKSINGNKKISSEIVLMIRCEEYQWESVQQVLWDNLALGVTHVK
jgi:uncharacterized protein YneF (UPF0154 family)